MRRRLLVLVVALAAAVVAALGVPLARALAEDVSQELFISRADDAARFADVAESALSAGRTERLLAELARYDELYGAAVLVVNADGQLVASSREGDDVTVPDRQAALLRALAGRPPDRPHVVWPWDERPYVVAEPIVRDSRVLGAAVTVSPTGRARGEVARGLALVGLGGVAALLLVIVGFALPVVRWVLRPVHDLDEASHEVALGHLGTHVSERTGPPELRRLASSFNAMADSVAAAVEKQRAFVAQASHQLRNPLTALRLRVENVEPYITDADGREELRLALEETGRLGETVDSLLELARTEASRAERRDVDVTTIVRSRVAAWRAAYDRCAMPLDVATPEGVVATCLPDLLDHALDALLDNALKFGAGGAVSVTVQPSGGVVDVIVRDSGPGLDAHELARAGDRFWRSPRHQNVRGTGLGLAITRALVESSGGTLELGPAQPHGLAVRLRLPASS